MSASPYQPINCGFYDQIEVAAMHGTASLLVYLARDGQTVEAQTRIADVFSRDQAEYLRLPDGAEIRLDRVLALGGTVRPGLPDTCRPRP